MKYTTEFELYYNALTNTTWRQVSPSEVTCLDDLITRLGNLNIECEARSRNYCSNDHNVFDSYCIFVIHYEKRGVETMVQMIIQDQGIFEIRRSTTTVKE